MKLRRPSLASATVAVLAAGRWPACSSSGGGSGIRRDGDPALPSLAFQNPTVAAIKKIVTDWNARTPEHPGEVLRRFVGLGPRPAVTQFQGGTAPDIIHDEAADISGFAQQGYLADI